MFAAAIAASAAAFADPINAISFEDESYTLGKTFANGGAEYNDFGDANAKYFCFTGGESNSSVVTNESPSTANDKRTATFKDSTNTKYLALDTEGGTFWRSINAMIEAQVGEGDEATTTYRLGNPKAVAATGTYLDTLVQFTVTEDEAPTVGENDKLAIWLQADEGTTNLMVKAGYYDASGTFISGGTNFVLSGVTVQPGTWYRLTVKAIDDVVDSTSEYASFYKLPVFTIQIDGTYLTATEATLPTEYTSGLGTSGILTQNTVSEFTNGKYFLNLQQGTPGVATTLQGVGFQGTGAVDEIVWTDDDPFPASVVQFTLTYTAGDANVTLGAVTYTIDGGEAQTVTFSNDAATIVSNATVTIAAPTFASGYQLAALTVGGTAVASPTFPYTFTLTADTTVAITSAAVASYPTYVGENATLRTQYDAWKTTNGADSESAYEKQFLLNVAPSTTVADDALVIESITESETAGAWDIVVSTTVTGAALSDGSAATYNGYLLVKAEDTLAGLATATPVAYPVTAVTGGKVKITVTAGKFMKAVLTTTAPAAPSAGE